MRFRRFIRTSAIAWLLATLAPTASASTFVLMDEADLVERSDAALIGSVARIESVGDQVKQAISTHIHIEPHEILFGDVAHEEIVLREIGGRLQERTEWVYGSPQYRVGEEVLVFVQRTDDGSLRTTAMAMGKFTLRAEAGVTIAVRDLGEGVAVLEPATGRLDTAPAPERRDLVRLAEQVRRQAARRARTRPHGRARPAEAPAPGAGEVTASFTYLSSPARWFQPDAGLAVPFQIDATGDAGVGAANSRAALNDAFAAWSSVPASGLRLEEGGLISPMPYAGCGGGNRIVFNDPFDEITDPTGCGGVLAIGGFCVTSETRVVNDTSFRRIVVGKITFNNGWSSCSGWNRCNLAEVATHELGHTIGFGHSSDRSATMSAVAHFDGRCASLRQDDIDAVAFVYPNTGVVGPTSTLTPSRTPTPTLAPTRTPTRTQTATRTNAPTWTPTRTRTAAATPTRTATKTPTPVPTWTQTSTRAPSSTSTPSPTHTSPSAATTSPTATATPRSTWTPTPTAVLIDTPEPTPTPSPTDTPEPTPTPVPRHRVTGRIRYYQGDKPVPAALVHLRGAGGWMTETANDGGYAFTDVSPGDWELAPERGRDSSRAVSALDAAYVLQSLSGVRSLSEAQRLACDVTGDGTVSSLDAARILQLNVGILSALPVAERCGQEWAFVPVLSDAALDTQAVPPRVRECENGKIVLHGLQGEAVGQDFDAVVFGDCTGNWEPERPELRRPGRDAARVRIGRLRRGRDGGTRVMLYVTSTRSFHSLRAVLRHDPGMVGAQVVARGRARDSSVALNANVPGQAVVSLASVAGLGDRGGALFEIVFATAPGSKPLPRVAIVEATVDEEPARTFHGERRGKKARRRAA